MFKAPAVFVERFKVPKLLPLVIEPDCETPVLVVLLLIAELLDPLLFKLLQSFIPPPIKQPPPLLPAPSFVVNCNVTGVTVVALLIEFVGFRPFDCMSIDPLPVGVISTAVGCPSMVAVK